MRKSSAGWEIVKTSKCCLRFRRHPFIAAGLTEPESTPFHANTVIHEKTATTTRIYGPRDSARRRHAGGSAGTPDARTAAQSPGSPPAAVPEQTQTDRHGIAELRRCDGRAAARLREPRRTNSQRTGRLSPGLDGPVSAIHGSEQYLCRAGLEAGRLQHRRHRNGCNAAPHPDLSGGAFGFPLNVLKLCRLHRRNEYRD